MEGNNCLTRNAPAIAIKYVHLRNLIKLRGAQSKTGFNPRTLESLLTDRQHSLLRDLTHIITRIHEHFLEDSRIAGARFQVVVIIEMFSMSQLYVRKRSQEIP